MATRVFSDAELDVLRGFPEITSAELIRYFRLAASDLEFARRRRGPRNQLGVAVQIAVLGWLGFVPDNLAPAPAAGSASSPSSWACRRACSAGTAAACRPALIICKSEVAGLLGWRTVGDGELKELDQFLSARAMEHDSPSLLFRPACEYLKSGQLIRPGPVVLVKRVAAPREAARAETYERVEHLLMPQRRTGLDRRLVVDADLGHTRLYWLRHGATQASPAAVRAEVDKLTFLRGLDADVIDLSAIPAERRRFLAGIDLGATGPTAGQLTDATSPISRRDSPT